MSDNSPCFPLARANFLQPNPYPCHTTAIWPTKTTEGNLPQVAQRAAMRTSYAVNSEKVAGTKRKNMDDDEFMADSRSPPDSPRQHDVDRANSMKRVRTGKDKEFPMNRLLATLDKSQILAVIHNLLDAHPNLQSEVASFIPPPTVLSAESALKQLEKRLHESFPYTRWGPSKDDYSFNRIRPHLLDLKEVILDYAAHFASPNEFPTNTFSYLNLAIGFVHRLPSWENEKNNEAKKELYEKLGAYWRKCIADAASKLDEGKFYTQAVVEEWAKNLAQHNHDSNGALNQAVNDFVHKLGWIIGNNKFPSSSYSSSSPLSSFPFTSSVS